MRRFTIVGLAALCALALSALGSVGASAAETTAFTCLPGGTEFIDADCSLTGAGSFHHEAIPANTPTQLTLKTISGEDTQTLGSTIGGASVILEGHGVSCMECMAENKGTAGAMEVTGAGGTIVYTGVHIVGTSLGCEVIGKETGLESSGVIETKPLKFTTTGTNEVKIEPVTAPVLAEFKIVKTGAGPCALVNTYKLNGDFNATLTGAIMSVNVPGNTTTLTLGVNKAGFAGKATVEAGVTGGNPFEHHATVVT